MRTIGARSSLAFSLHANRGAYALLLGSGLSRAAGIPTGWEVTVELVRKIAAVKGVSCEPDPVAWFRGQLGSEPDYSELLNSLAKTPAERQQLLRPYFEPTATERAEGAKLPTKAHRAIADLVQRGFIRVIITTNFDRLLETALHDAGVRPTVLSTPDHIQGALPLVHTSCTVIKIHGDYLDTRILNTPRELAEYPEPFRALLDRVFDEFGLIVAGWSADWDEALRSALTRAPYRWFMTYWASKGEPSEKAADLIGSKGATLIPITDADRFFTNLDEQVKSLEDFARPHPLSAEAAVASLKRYIPDARHRIDFHDLIINATDSIVQTTKSAQFEVNSNDVSGEAIERRVRAYESASEILMRMAFVGGQWCDAEQSLVWSDALNRLLLQRSAGGGVTLWLDLQRYPAALLLYSFGLGAVDKGNWAALQQMFSRMVRDEHRGSRRAVEMAALWALFEHGADVMKKLPGGDRRHTLFNERVATVLWEMVGRNFPDKATFDFAFDQLEVLVALSFAIPDVAAKGDHYWAPPGIFGWRKSNRTQIIEHLKKTITEMGDVSPLVQSKLLGSTPVFALENLKRFEEFLGKLRWW